MGSRRMVVLPLAFPVRIYTVQLPDLNSVSLQMCFPDYGPSHRTAQACTRITEPFV